VILGGFGCGPDFSGDQTLAMTIGAHQAGLIRLIGVVDDDGNANGSNSVGWWREMLDQAGLNDVPLSVGGGSQTSNVGGCPTANITGYNASTPQNASSYESALTMYRTLFARYPSAPIYVLMTQTANGYNNFQLSPADGISPLTGLQLQTRNYANGGWINGFQGNLNLTPSSYASVWTNMGTGPVYMWGGSPASGGPGVLVSRTATDPLYLTATLAGAPADVVAGWTNLNLAQVITSYFGGGEMVTVSGGTGYASTTKFTSVGGGPACNVTGLMAATSGVPNGMLKAWGVAPAATYDGIGYGCTPASFTATGSGTSLTVSAVSLLEMARQMDNDPALMIRTAADWLRVRDRDGGMKPLIANAAQRRFEERTGTAEYCVEGSADGHDHVGCGEVFSCERSAAGNADAAGGAYARGGGVDLSHRAEDVGGASGGPAEGAAETESSECGADGLSGTRQ
jgi:hypothetical protein